MSFSNTLEDAVLDHFFGGAAYTPVSTLWIGLSTADPGENSAGMAEPSGNGYARIAVVNSSNFWSPAASGHKRNAVAFTFPTATGSWGLVSHAAVFTNATSTSGSVFLGSGALGTSKNVTNGDTPAFGVGSLDITLD
jgi:hypothetical protein